MSQKDIDRYELVKDDIWENAAYDELEDEAKAGKLITALNRAIFMIPQLASHGGSQAEEIRHDIATWREMLTGVREWLHIRRNRTRAGFRLHGATRMPHRHQWGNGSLSARDDLQAE